MIRLLIRPIVHNWPLKLGAILMASLLYVGLVLSSSAKSYDGSIPIEATGVSPDVTILSDLGAVSRIRYFAPEDLGLRLDTTSFRAVVNLASVPANGGRQTVTVAVTAVDPRIQVLDYEPRQITVQLDAVVTRSVPVRAVLGPIPSGLDVGDPTLSAATVEVTGAASIVNKVAEAQARLTVDASGIDINRFVDLLPVDAAGEPLTPVDVEPSSIQVKVPIFTDRQTRSLPVRPEVTGTPAAGFEVASVEVTPLVVSVEGDVDDIASLEFADTAPVPIGGSSSTVAVDVALALPDGVQAPGVQSVHVVVTLRPVTATRTFEAGIVLRSARTGFDYAFDADRAIVTIGGSVAALDLLSGAGLVVTLDVGGLDAGTYDLPLQINLQTGLTLVGITPARVTVTVSSLVTPPPAATPTPAP